MNDVMTMQDVRKNATDTAEDLRELDKWVGLASMSERRVSELETKLNKLETLIFDLIDLDDGKYQVGNWPDIETINQVKKELAARPMVGEVNHAI